eukprot:1057455-Prorocentrum_minimum.AAC.1
MKNFGFPLHFRGLAILDAVMNEVRPLHPLYTPSTPPLHPFTPPGLNSPVVERLNKGLMVLTSP